MRRSDSDRIRALLERTPDIAEDGFTARVLSRLPPPRRAIAPREGPARTALLFGFAALGCGAAYVAVGGHAVASGAVFSGAPVLSVGAALALLLTVSLASTTVEE